jgi:hypothetical protein
MATFWPFGRREKEKNGCGWTLDMTSRGGLSLIPKSQFCQAQGQHRQDDVGTAGVIGPADPVLGVLEEDDADVRGPTQYDRRQWCGGSTRLKFFIREGNVQWMNSWVAPSPAWRSLSPQPILWPRGRQTTSTVLPRSGTVEVMAAAAVGVAAALQAEVKATGAIRIPEARAQLEYNAENASVLGIRLRIARAKVRNEIAVG